ncbi:Multimodular transpeptidase-transglycosylase [Chitinispirillum alkaliphilum]|nr:Multimodular transpeptidase-transglycosylase [Chitinispirillum alkaliphilum]
MKKMYRKYFSKKENTFQHYLLRQYNLCTSFVFRKGFDKPGTILKLSAVCVLVIPVMVISFAFFFSLFDIYQYTPRPSWLLLDRNYQFVAEIESPDGLLGYWPVPDTIPHNIRLAVLAAEDHRFDSHIGVDPKSVVRAVVNNYFKKKGYSGASTIGMQTARLQRGGGSSWFLKIRDTFTSIWSTLIYGREHMLRRYLTLAPYGNRISGVSYASRRYFLKPVEDLSLAESALLVAVPRAPGRMNLFSPRGFNLAKQRAHFILRRCLSYGWISQEEFYQSLVELETFVRPRKELREEANLHLILSYRDILLNDKQPDSSPLLVTTIDVNLQRTLHEEMYTHLEELNNRDVENGAAIIIDHSTGEVLAYLGSGSYFGSGSGAIDHGNILRSTGSLLKPFIYAFGMEELGFTGATILDDMNFDFGAGSSSFIPENSDRSFQGPVLYKNALANSRNIPAVEVLNSLGVNNTYRRLSDFALAEDDGRGEHYGLGLSIGTLYTTLRSISQAYLTFPNQGKSKTLVWFRDQPQQSQQQLLSADIALMIQRYLAEPMARVPTFPRGGFFEYPFSVAVKTGTSDGYRDAWCIAWSDTYLVGVWFGNADNHPTHEIGGYKGAAPLVKDVFTRLHPERMDGLDDILFPPPPDYIPVSVCRLTGLRADRSSPFITEVYFKPGTDPQEYSDVSRILSIDSRNGLLALPGCNHKYIVHRPFLLLPPKYRNWAQNQGLAIPPTEYSPLCQGSIMVEEYSLNITSPRSGSRFFIDPEMPPGHSNLQVHCLVSPGVPELIWFVNGEEYTITNPPHNLKWPMKRGRYNFKAAVPGTPAMTETITIEVF